MKTAFRQNFVRCMQIFEKKQAKKCVFRDFFEIVDQKIAFFGARSSLKIGIWRRQWRL